MSRCAVCASRRLTGTNTTQAYDPQLSFYDSTQDADLSDRVSAVLLHLGTDYPIGERTRLGAKLTYAWVDEIADTSRYALHPMHARDPDFTNENTFGSASGWQLSLVVKFAVSALAEEFAVTALPHRRRRPRRRRASALTASL